MNDRHNPLYFSLPLGTWFSTQVRLSVFFPLMAIVFCYQLGLQLGLIFTGIMFASVLLHEFGHVLGARWTGGMADEILIWPLGGLAFVQPSPNVWSRFLTAAAGPAMNLALCLIAFVEVYHAGAVSASLNPIVLPIAEVSSENLAGDLLLLTFAANWLLLLINLVPVYPLDGGQMLQALLASRLGNEPATVIYLRIGFVCAFALMFGGLMWDLSWLVFIGGVILVFNMHETQQLRSGDSYDDSFMGYDFSQGYTSLEKSAAVAPHEPRPGLLARWRERRRAKREMKEREQQLQAEQQLDEILDKVHREGFQSLTEAEKRILRRASDRYRDKRTEAE